MRFPAALPLLFLPVSAVLGAADSVPATDPAETRIVLKPYPVRDVPFNSYSFDVSVYANKQTHLITHLYITAVGEGSDAEQLGLKAGDEIIKLDGKPVKAMHSEFTAGGELFQLLVNRRPGEKLQLEVMTHRLVEVTLIAPIPVPQR